MHALDKIINSREFASSARKCALLTLPTAGLREADKQSFGSYLAGAFMGDAALDAAWARRYANWRAIKIIPGGSAGRGLAHATHD